MHKSFAGDFHAVGNGTPADIVGNQTCMQVSNDRNHEEIGTRGRIRTAAVRGSRERIWSCGPGSWPRSRYGDKNL